MDTVGYVERYEQLGTALLESISFVNTEELFDWVRSLLLKIKVLEEKLDEFSRYDEVLVENEKAISSLQKLVDERGVSIEEKDKEIKAIREENIELHRMLSDNRRELEKMDRTLKDKVLEVEDLTKKIKEMEASLEKSKAESEVQFKNLMDILNIKGNEMEARHQELTRNCEQEQARLRRASLVVCYVFVTIGKILKKISASQGGPKIPHLDEIRRQWETVRESMQLDKVIPSLALWKDCAHLVPEELKSRYQIGLTTTAVADGNIDSQTEVANN